MKPLTILTVFASVSIFETALLLAFAVPNTDSSSGVLNFPHACTFVSAFLVIPAIGGLVSVLMHGPQRWVRRTILIMAVPLAIAAGLIGLAALASQFDDPVPAMIFLAVFVSATLVLVATVWKRTRRTGFELDLERWHDQRRRGIRVEQARRVNRAIRAALWFPCLTVLLVFLFLPEALGLASHLIYLDARRIGDYLVPLPTTSVIVGGSDDRKALYVLLGTGFARSLRAGEDFPLDFAISSWSFRMDASPIAQGHLDSHSDSRAIMIHDVDMTCLTYRPQNLYPKRRTWVFIDCRAPDGFAAQMDGDEEHLQKFYSVLSKITKVRR